MKKKISNVSAVYEDTSNIFFKVIAKNVKQTKKRILKNQTSYLSLYLQWFINTVIIC